MISHEQACIWLLGSVDSLDLTSIRLSWFYSKGQTFILLCLVSFSFSSSSSAWTETSHAMQYPSVRRSTPSLVPVTLPTA